MKIKALLYCTKAKPYLRKLDNYFLDKHNDNYYWERGQTTPCNINGKIVAECDYAVEKIENNVGGFGDYKLPYFKTETLTGKEIEDKSCLSYGQLKGYLQNNGNGFYGYSGYAIHIKNLHIFDKPKELSKCHKIISVDDADFNENDYKYVPITKAPQNMMKVWLYENGEWVMYILISIKPQWMCKILNGNKTIEVRKVVLKEMI
ncbi:MAG: hypothetical protein IKF82_00980 [Bacilli bacterium]|nr:hypothetical protein [Bacilli bacterium]